MTNPVRAVDRALDILLCFTTEKSSLSLTQISERVGMHKSTIHRLINTLEAKHFIKRDHTTGLYSLGFRLIELASLANKDSNLQHVLPYLHRLADECGETVDLAVLDGSDVVYLLVVESPQRVKLAARVGQRLPAHCTATGKSFLAFLSDKEVESILGGMLTRYTENTLIDREELRRAICLTRERGFATSESEFENDINAVAAPVLDPNLRPIASIAVAGPSYRMPAERMQILGNQIQATILAMTNDIGMTTISEMVVHRDSNNSITG